nr:MAG TPA: hypothetical protein [Caudoviricetes sp.]
MISLLYIFKDLSITCVFLSPSLQVLSPCVVYLVDFPEK